MTRNTDRHTFYIIGICPWTNMPPTSHIYVPLHYYCGLHIDLTLLHRTCEKTSVFIYHAIAISVLATNMALKCHIYATYANYFICTCETTMSAYNAINNVTSSTGIHIFHITNKYAWTNILATLHLYVPLYFYYCLHIYPTYCIHP